MLKGVVVVSTSAMEILGSQSSTDRDFDVFKREGELQCRGPYKSSVRSGEKGGCAPNEMQALPELKLKPVHSIFFC